MRVLPTSHWFAADRSGMTDADVLKAMGMWTEDLTGAVVNAYVAVRQEPAPGTGILRAVIARGAPEEVRLPGESLGSDCRLFPSTGEPDELLVSAWRAVRLGCDYASVARVCDRPPGVIVFRYTDPVFSRIGRELCGDDPVSSGYGNVVGAMCLFDLLRSRQKWAFELVDKKDNLAETMIDNREKQQARKMQAFSK